MSPELETLDQLLCGALSLGIILRLYPDASAFQRGVHGLLSVGDVRLLAGDGIEVPAWRWRELFIEGGVMNTLDQLMLDITDQGARRIG
jgi:hypothetical protein